jgi:hypothetical protein
LYADKSFSRQLPFAPRALVDNLMTFVVSHSFPLSCFGLGPQASSAEAGTAIELTLLDAW